MMKMVPLASVTLIESVVKFMLRFQDVPEDPLILFIYSPVLIDYYFSTLTSKVFRPDAIISKYTIFSSIIVEVYTVQSSTIGLHLLDQNKYSPICLPKEVLMTVVLVFCAYSNGQSPA